MHSQGGPDGQMPKPLAEIILPQIGKISQLRSSCRCTKPGF
jgi:hypothetical protein